jgi:signal transduction histidine kinase
MAVDPNTPASAPVAARGFSLRTKMLLLATLLVLAPGVVLTLLAGRSATRSLEQVIERQLAREAGHTAERLSAVVHGERDSLESFARQDLMRDVRVGDVDKRVAKALTTLRDGNALRLDYVVATTGGEIVAASQAALVGRAPEWMEAAWTRAGSEARTFGPIEVPGLGTVLALAAPVPDPDDPARKLGTLVGLLDWRRLTSLAEGVRGELAEQGVPADVLLCRADGAVIGGARDERSRPPFLSGTAALASDLPSWRVVVREARSQALRPVDRLGRDLAATMGVALSAALVLATLAAGRLVRPLAELTAGIREIARGGPARAPVPVRGEDEIAALAAAFNDMASRLDHTQRELLEAEKFAFVGELAAGVAHQIRTSLGVLGSSAQMLERSLGAHAVDGTAELAQMIRAEVARLGGVVDELLTLHRARPLQLEAVAASEVLARAVEFVRPQAREKGVVLELDRPAREPRLACDAELMQQVAINLLVNAIQAVDEGGRVAARVVVDAVSGQGGFDVLDDGPGIPVELRERVFRPFVTSRAGGVGIGLTFVKRAVHEHHGSVSVAPGGARGACIQVRLPVDGR